MVKAGIISDLATGVLSLTGGRTDLAALMVLWMSGFISAIVDNIPYTVTMVPLIQALGQNVDREPLIWALALGANLGGNATIVGASANVVVASMSEARGYPITFVQYLRYGVPATLATMVVGDVRTALEEESAQKIIHNIRCLNRKLGGTDRQMPA